MQGERSLCSSGVVRQSDMTQDTADEDKTKTRFNFQFYFSFLIYLR